MRANDYRQIWSRRIWERNDHAGVDVLTDLDPLQLYLARGQQEVERKGEEGTLLSLDLLEMLEEVP